MANYLIKQIRFILFTILIVINHVVFAQGNTPCTATSITSNTSCVNTSGTTASLSYSNNAANAGTPSCASPGAPDGWYSFTPASTGTYTISLTAGTITDSGMSIYTNSSGCSGTFTEVECDDDDGTGSMSQIIRALTAGTQYFIRIWEWSSSTGGTFSICITSPPNPPANDNCSGATALPCGTSNLAGTTVGTTIETAPSGCASAYGVWYTFAGNGQSTTISSTASSGFDHEIDIFSGSCGSLTNISCVDGAGSGGVENYTFSSVNGTTYYVYVAYFTIASTTGAFTISRTCATPPTDPCSTTTNIASCGTSISTTFASGNGSYGASACGFLTGGVEKIFTFTPATTGNYFIQQGSSFDFIDYQFKLASAGCSSSGWTCVDDISGAGTSFTSMALTAGTQYYILLDPESTIGGNVTFTINCPPLPPADPCLTTTNVASCGTSISTTFASGTGSYATSACGFSTGGVEKIFTFTPTTTGNYFIQQGSSFDFIDYQFKLASAGCSSSGWTCVDDISGAGTSFTSMALTAGTQYYILLDPESTIGGNVTFSINCPPLPPADPCLTTTNVASCGTSISTTFASGTGSYSTSACGFSTGGVEKIFTFTPTTTGNYFIQQGSSFDFIDYQFKLASAGCSSSGWTCVDDISGAGTSFTSIALTAGTQYYILLDPESTIGGNVTFTINCPPTPPANDNCSGSYSVAVSTSSLCVSSTTATSTNATQSLVGCTGNADDDVWFSFIASSTSLLVSVTPGTLNNAVFEVFTGTCAGLTTYSCANNTSGSSDESSVIDGLITGNTYFVRVYSNGNNTNTGTFSVCVTTPPPPPANDNCTGAYAAAVSSVTACTSLTNGTLLGATASSQVNNCVSGNDGNDVWYSFVATSTTHSITINNVAGNTTDLYHSVYAGSCSSIGNAIVCSDPNNSTVNGLTPGNTYYLRVYTYYSTPNANTTFSVCIRTGPSTGACGNPANNDYCSNPATLTQAAGTFSSTTSSIYSSDQSSPLFSIFCGSIENNSWYSFVASGTTASFPFTSITGCVWNDGIQAEVYSVTTNASGCCTGFTSMSNCYNPGTTATGTVNATGLTIGQTYILMVDGYAGDVCNFTVNGWTAIGVLPIELLAFTGRNEETKNKIQWVTATEINSNYFVLEKSKNGLDFESLLTVNAANNSLSNKYYNAFDLNPFENITYYRLNLFDLDGTSEYSNVIAIDNSNLTNFISSARPNPTQGNIEFDINTKGKETISIELFNTNGLLINSEKHNSSGGYETLHFDLSSYESGLYLLKVTFENSGKSEIIKVIKN